MNKREFSVHGSSVTELPGALYEELRRERKGAVEWYDGDGFDVIAVERYYLRNNSDQQATVIFDAEEEGTLRITILAGGGGAGLLQINLGSHRTQTKELEDRIVELCRSDELQLEVTD
ncbi:hypothetical protein [Halosolutus gelatinilyticus]|uniref:hypothetical protein n=1 Tax=Halosolutus gelatinilyticus TaxID=2931975 RepID=UPI001FF643F9|nr:hypothetical protein [Halosolutus gelatinilyticus]